jgi:DNA-binding MarR family transcriptional regulator
MHKTKVSRAVAALEAKGLAARETNAEDLRAAFLTLTQRGRRIYQDLAPRALAFEEALDAAIGARARAQLDALLRQLEARAQELAQSEDWSRP